MSNLMEFKSERDALSFLWTLPACARMDYDIIPLKNGMFLVQAKPKKKEEK